MLKFVNKELRMHWQISPGLGSSVIKANVDLVLT